MDWDKFLLEFPDAHLLQTSPWGELKGYFGWNVDHLIWNDWGVQILKKQIAPYFKMAYVAKGPVAPKSEIIAWLKNDPHSGNVFFNLLDEYCLDHKIVFLKIEPDEQDQKSIPSGFIQSENSIQPLNTILIHIQDEEEQILKRMKPKTRYNIRLAERKGVKVEYTENIDIFYKLSQQTSDRDQFGIHSLEYYQEVYRLFHNLDQCQLLIAYYENIAISALMVFAWGKRAWYLYGASSNDHRETMAPYLLQWEAIRWAKRKGCETYDLWGIPDFEEAYLENNFLRFETGLWGVYRFKRGFGGQVVRSAGSYDRVYHPGLYQIYRLLTRVRGMSE